MSYKGKFKPLNPEKYKGDVNNIFWRSSWECKYMMKLDKNSDVISWSSEEIIVPYRSPIDDKIHRYFPDFIVSKKVGNEIITEMIEIKPYIQTLPPKLKSENTRKQSRRYLKEAATFMVNQSKWQAAKKYCDQRGWNFVIVTEKNEKNWELPSYAKKKAE